MHVNRIAEEIGTRIYIFTRERSPRRETGFRHCISAFTKHGVFEKYQKCPPVYRRTRTA